MSMDESTKRTLENLNAERIRLEKELQHSENVTRMTQKKMEIAMASSNLAVWECLFDQKINVYTEETVKRFHIPEIVEHVPEGLIASGDVHPDYCDQLLNMYYSVMHGAPEASGEIKVFNNGKIRWLKMQLTTVFDDGKAVSAICTAEDITANKELLLKLEDEVTRRAAYEVNLRARGYFDLTDDVILEYEATRLIADNREAMRQYSDVFSLIVGQMLDQTAVQHFTDFFTAEKLMDQYQKGITEQSYEYRRMTPEAAYSWVSTKMILAQRPSDRHIVAFLYTTDIQEKKLAEAVLRVVTEDNFEDIKLIETESRHYRSYEKNLDPVFTVPFEGDDFWTDLDTLVQGLSSESDYTEYRENHNYEKILKSLEEKRKHTFTINSRPELGSRIFKIQFAYLDERRQYIIGTNVDITEAVNNEKLQKEMLESALLAARQASMAKSDFLSRMSHEIRTPMNAILGMVALAAQADGNPEEMMDCVSKIGISGHYLLSLINDILDMSRIESGKMLLHNSAFNFSEFVEGINTIVYGQAVAKGIDYEVVVSHGLEDGYIGDAMKLQQVLINILGNAVKFTPNGGKITFSIHLLTREEKKARIRFTINDTGCGIPEEAQERIFDPFEQQNSTISGTYGGTGLGLAIAKNLVELMGGQIKVRSIVDVGSEFTIEVPLNIDPSLALTRPAQYTFQNLRTLIVDDDLIICEQTSKTLEEIGMIPEWVTSGREAVARVDELFNKGQNYDFILVDWKMPEMDGIETSRQIRRIVGPDVTIIVMTAYDWASIENEARAAGVNMCISKPMFKSTLVSAFTKATTQTEREKILTEGIDIDFEGKRVLLVEDHQMNIEIAKRLLENRHCSVDVAENGLKALEAFTGTEPGYYDAILMDIRMPVMDGLQAARNIRGWNKKDAKTVPIIAMTANAFDEDVDRSHQAGMDAHLAKPIDPELLYRVLYRLIK